MESMEDELWMRKIKERLEDYSEPLPAAGWERLEKELSSPKRPVAGKRRMMLIRRWSVAAAAALLVAVSSVSVWMLQSTVGEEMRNTAAPALAAAPDELPLPQVPAAVQQEVVADDYEARSGSLRQNPSHRSLLAQQIRVVKVDEKELVQEVETAEAVEAAQNLSQEKEETAVREEETVADRKENDEVRTRRSRPSGRDKLHLPVAKKENARSRGWSVGLSVGNTGGVLSGNNPEGAPLYMDSPMFGSGPVGDKIDLTEVSNGILNVPEGQELVFKDGMPYLRSNGKRIEDIKHKQPLSFGISVRKGLAKGFSVETGLTYTYLASDVKFERSNEKVSQKLHYIGIPLRANWNFVDKKAFVMYVSAGGAVEKCVYGKMGSEEETVKPLQFSVMGAVGAQYNLSGRVGLYVEPGVSYFFDDGSEVQTIRKENPCNFTLQAGIRLTY